MPIKRASSGRRNSRRLGGGCPSGGVERPLDVEAELNRLASLINVSLGLILRVGICLDKAGPERQPRPKQHDQSLAVYVRDLIEHIRDTLERANVLIVRSVSALAELDELDDVSQRLREEHLDGGRRHLLTLRPLTTGAENLERESSRR